MSSFPKLLRKRETVTTLEEMPDYAGPDQIDPEVRAITQCVEAFKDLPEGARCRVLEYLAQRFSRPEPR